MVILGLDATTFHILLHSMHWLARAHPVLQQHILCILLSYITISGLTEMMWDGKKYSEFIRALVCFDLILMLSTFMSTYFLSLSLYADSRQSMYDDA